MNMKTGTIIIRVTAVLVCMAAPAIAAAKGREDSSYLVIWAFLSFCALIVVSQLIPVISSFLAARKAVKEHAQKVATVSEKN